jgi:hypothetical protein
MAAQARSKLLTFILSLAPGVGHLYLGLMNRGLQFMIALFGSFFLMDFFGLQGFALLLPIIWFYALFDALQMAEAIHSGELVEDTPLIPWDRLKVGNTWIGWGLITLGGYLIIRRILPPLLPGLYSIQYIIQTAFVSVLLILGGIRILVPQKERED